MLVFTVVISVYVGSAVRLFVFTGRGAELGTLGVGVVPLTSDSEAFVPPGAGISFA